MRHMSHARWIDRLLELTKGVYQRDLILGYYSFNNNSPCFRGKAKNWSSRYRASRINLMHRIEQAGLGHLKMNNRRRVILVQGKPPKDAERHVLYSYAPRGGCVERCCIAYKYGSPLK